MSQEGGVVDVRTAAESVITGSDDAPLHELESLCMRCGENGTTRFLITKIPHFREVVLMAFECPHCNERNNEVQFAGQIQPQGCTYTLNVPAGDPKVLNRQVVKSDSGTIKVPEIELEVPPEAQRGQLSTFLMVEGVLLRAARELEELQQERWKVDPKTAEAIDAFLLKLKACATGEQAFTFVVDDPSGNSYIENPNAPTRDPILSAHFYDRTPEQHAALGFLAETHGDQPSVSQNGNDVASAAETIVEQHQQHRYTPAGTVRVPHGSVGAQGAHRAIAQGNSEAVAAALFKYSAPEELKPGGSIPDKGKRISVRIKSSRDLNRDVIKSDTAMVEIPEVELELAPGTLGGLVTTVEGLVCQISESLLRVHGFSIGDSADPWQKSKWQDFDQHLKELLNVEKEWTLILDDALANSFIAPATDDYDKDNQLTSEEYIRTWEQDEELGLNDMDTSSADVA